MDETQKRSALDTELLDEIERVEDFGPYALARRRYHEAKEGLCKMIEAEIMGAPEDESESAFAQVNALAVECGRTFGKLVEATLIEEPDKGVRMELLQTEYQTDDEARYEFLNGLTESDTFSMLNEDYVEGMISRAVETSEDDEAIVQYIMKIYLETLEHQIESVINMFPMRKSTIAKIKRAQLKEAVTSTALDIGKTAAAMAIAILITRRRGR